MPHSKFKNRLRWYTRWNGFKGFEEILHCNRPEFRGMDVEYCFARW